MSFLERPDLAEVMPELCSFCKAHEIKIGRLEPFMPPAKAQWSYVFSNDQFPKLHGMPAIYSMSISHYFAVCSTKNEYFKELEVKTIKDLTRMLEEELKK